MNQVLKAIDHAENALLEAPTGCGKTLSLLCGALAWQTAQKQKKLAAEHKAEQQRKAAAEAAGPAGDAKPNCLAPIKSCADAAGGGAGDPSSCDSADGAQVSSEDEPVVVPKIYYATRTHSQIAQVVRELKRTTYRPKMAVLGSRPHYCINKAVIRTGNIDGECEKLLKEEERGCAYKKAAATITHGLVRVHDIEDLARIGTRHKACPYFAARHLADSAELVFCPYSYLLDPNIRRATKVAAADAILIFDEAHNIEDQAREAGSTELDLEVLMATCLALKQAAEFSSEADNYLPLADAVAQVVEWMQLLAERGTESAGFKSTGFERFERVWTGQQMLSALSEAGLGMQEVEHLWAVYERARAAEEKAGFSTEGEAGAQPVPSNVKSPKAGGPALGCVSSLLTVLRLMYGNYSEAPPQQQQQQQQPEVDPATGQPLQAKCLAPAGDYVPDYRLAVQMWVPREQSKPRGGRRGAFEAAPSSSRWGLALCLWCLNPAVVFRSLSEVARSVLLTSGTLSPLDSFSGELGLNFHIKLEAPHVVDMHKQVMARVVSHGPDGRLLNATFREADKLEYQDSLGQLALAVAGTVPDGVLLFLPSYSLMDKLRERWKVTGVWGQLQRLKQIVPEPRKAGDEFDAAIAQYYKAVAEGRGGLFMAVCRGKASEGIDFADGNARCVMIVGIPFPNVKDSKVGLKKDYNSSAAAASAAAGRGGSSSSGWCGGRPGGAAAAGGGAAAAPPRLLTGDSWYSQQAFRALNQAVGRCIRHRLDYGAILLVDERFRQPRHQACLSKWVRGAIGPASNTQELLADLKGFFAGLAANPPGGGAALSTKPHHVPGELQLVKGDSWRAAGQTAATAAAAA
ncbi:hypothetical protein OEZ85_010410 [Tetradesmus obliquus]|uniref:Helicase ATP-binding domain-containing protein n=1 Tax=Tetradesmus obliquus TaxID=3088 RepID=A0ABY8TM67_TETOB|nr:hypothetical protein OEZ85_010410 [Tetradesmus obliquus]